MGFAVFTLRKIMLDNRVHNLNSKLMEISQKKMDLSDYSAAIADGNLGDDEKHLLAGNMGGQLGSFFRRNSSVASQMTDTFMKRNGEGMTVEDSQETRFLVYQQLMLNAARTQQKKIDAEEKKLDMQQQKIQTQLRAAEQELQSVQSAEEKAIDRSVPKYV